jgi:hypothetical protein
MLQATRLTRDNHRPVELPPCVTPSLTYYPLGSHADQPQHPKALHQPVVVSIRSLGTGRMRTGTGISTRYPSTTPVGLALGPDSPWAD